MELTTCSAICLQKVRDLHTINTRSSAKGNLSAEKSSLDLRKHFFSNRVVADWNSLPQATQEAKSLAVFKSKLKSFRLKSPDKQFKIC